MLHTKHQQANLKLNYVRRNYVSFFLNSDDKCFVYLVTCQQCNKQYTDETTDLFRNRCNNYKDNARKFGRKESCVQEHLYKHFQTEGHKGFLNEASVTFLIEQLEKI